MKTPTWGIVVGILMILFGGCGAMTDLQQINMPNMLDMQNKMWDGMSKKRIENDSLAAQNYDSTAVSSDQKNSFDVEDIAKSMEEVFHISEFTRTWMVRFGYIGLFVVLIYMLAGVFLLIKRNFSIKLAYGAIALSMVFGITQWLVLASDPTTDQLIGVASGTSQLFGLVIDFVLLVAIWAADKTAYYPEEIINE